MKTRNKWLIFWGVFASLFLILGIVIASGNFPQFSLPFQFFATAEQQKEPEKLPKIAGLQLQDYNDQELLTQHLEKVALLNEKMADENAYANSVALTNTLQEVFGELQDEKQGAAAFRAIYPAISREKGRFVSAQLVGFGKEKQSEAIIDSEKELLTFVDSQGTRSDYLLTLNKNADKVQRLTLDPLQKPITNLLNDHDTYLTKGADFETQWGEFTEDNSDVELYKNWKKTDFDPNDAAVKALTSSLSLEDANGFPDLFKDTRGDLASAALIGFYHSNENSDGNTEYTFAVPVSKEKQHTYQVNYDRLKEKITGIKVKQGDS